tara:strand:+ start:25 stop:570 length:546 start_codon:yes stop_codon:yes gene_type:complete
MKKFILWITLSRIILGPLIFIAIIFELFFLSLFLIILSGVSDFLDGYLARKFNATSDIGKILDPIADKILICFSLIAITILLESNYIAFLSSIIIAREIWVSGLRDYNSLIGNIGATEVTFLAKSKTALQIITVCSYLFGLLISNALIIFLSDWFLFISALITVKTGLDYSSKSNIFRSNK